MEQVTDSPTILNDFRYMQTISIDGPQTYSSDNTNSEWDKAIITTKDKIHDSLECTNFWV